MKTDGERIIRTRPERQAKPWNLPINSLSDNDPMPFGKHQGAKMKDVPASYLHYLWSSGIKDETSLSRKNVARYIERNLNALRKEYKDGIWS